MAQIVELAPDTVPFRQGADNRRGGSTGGLYKRPEFFWDLLEREVIGQRELKPKLAHAFSHYTAFMEDAAVGRPTLLVYGPSGAGASPAGYKGTTLRDLMTQHYMAAEYREEGVVFLDEIDKTCRASMAQHGGDDRDKVGVGVGLQHELLRMIEHERIEFIDEAKDIEELEGRSVDTGRLMFAFAGAFGGLDGIIRQRTGQEQIAIEDIWEHAEVPDFVRYGMVEEFALRISSYGWVRRLNSHELVSILNAQEVPRWHRLFQFLECELELDPGAVATCAAHAFEHQSGPRGARMMFQRVMGDVYSEAGRHQLARVRVDSQTMVHGHLIL